MIPQFNINWNRIISSGLVFLGAVAAYYITAPELRAAIALFVQTLQGAISVKAQTMDPDGKSLAEYISWKGETNYESAKTQPDGKSDS